MANDINCVILVGRLTRDAELKYTNTGSAVSKLSVAVNRRKRSGDQWTDEANFFDVTIWGKMAESLNQYLNKGKQVAIEGELRQSRWEQDGQSRSKVEIVARNIQLLGGRSEGSGGGGGYAPRQNDGPADNGGYNSQQSYSQPKPQMPTDFEDDIPF